MKEVTLGLDVGSTTIKALLYDPASGSALHMLAADLPARIEAWQNGRYEHSPQDIQSAVFHLIRAIAAYALESDLHIAAIGFTGQMHGGLIVDQDLNPITKFITWQDKRGDERAAGTDHSYVERLREAQAEDPTGVGIHTGFLLATVDWLASNGDLPSAHSKVLGIYDWIASVLLGRAVTDMTSAAAWGMFDIVRKEWKHDLLATAGIQEALLPEIVEPGARLGFVQPDIADTLGLPSDVQIVNSIGDTQASYIGSGCQSNEILLNFGTGSQSMWETTSAVATAATDIRYLGNGRYIVTAPTLAGGKAYHILADFFRDVVHTFAGASLDLESVYRIMNEEASTATSCNIQFSPLFNGSRFRAERERASITQITAEAFTTSSITRALIAGMVEEIALPYFVREGAVRHAGLVGAGNGMRRNGALRRVAAERFGLPLRLSSHEEEAAMGTAILASRATR